MLTYLSPFSQEFKGYVFKIMGGCDKQGFPMKQGVLTAGRVRLLLHRGKKALFLLLTFGYSCPCSDHIMLLVWQAHLASVGMAGVMVSAGGSLSVVASSARTYLLLTW